MTKSVCNRDSTLSTGVMYGYGMVCMPSASAMDVRLSPVPQLTSAERQARREGDRERAGVKFSWSKAGGMFLTETHEIAIRPHENAFPGPRCGSRQAWKLIATR